MTRRSVLLAMFLVLLGLGLANQPASAQDGVTNVDVESQTRSVESTSQFFVQFGIAGNPTSLAIENTGRAWVTLPELDAIGLISVTETTSQTVTAYLVRTYFLAPGSQPYDLVLRSGEVWFTAYGGNWVGRLEPSTGTLQTYPIPISDSGPTGIDVAPDGMVWFAQQKANRLSKLNPGTGAFQAFAYPLPNGGLEEVATINSNSIWVTAPNVDRIANLDPLAIEFNSVPTLPFTRPVGLALEPGDVPWVSVNGGNLIGRYAPGTVALWRWTELPRNQVEGGAQRIALTGGSAPRTLFYANALAQAIGRVFVGADTDTGSIRQLAAPGSACTPLDVKIDGDGNAWFTCGPANTVVIWRSPYSLDQFLPIMEWQVVEE